jgi:hypothetical protein
MLKSVAGDKHPSLFDQSLGDVDKKFYTIGTGFVYRVEISIKLNIWSPHTQIFLEGSSGHIKTFYFICNFRIEPISYSACSGQDF